MKLTEHVSLRPFNTFGIDVEALRLAEVEASAADMAQLHEVVGNEPWLMLGAGSNMVFTSDYRGTIVRIAQRGVEFQADGFVVVDAGLLLDDLISACLARGLYGIENLSAIPGTVGAAVVQNVGAYGVEIQEAVRWVEAYDMHSRHVLRLGRDACRFGYRSSLFKALSGSYVILRVAVQLSRQFTPRVAYHALAGLPCFSAAELREGIVALRWSKLPRPEAYGSAGSFFKNPVVTPEVAAQLKTQYPDMPLYSGGKLSAGWLIEQCGWKGRSMGRAGVWPQQALILYNLGGCTGREVVALAEAIRADVARKFNVFLEPEAIII